MTPEQRITRMQEEGRERQRARLEKSKEAAKDIAAAFPILQDPFLQLLKEEYGARVVVVENLVTGQRIDQTEKYEALDQAWKEQNLHIVQERRRDTDTDRDDHDSHRHQGARRRSRRN